MADERNYEKERIEAAKKYGMDGAVRAEIAEERYYQHMMERMTRANGQAAPVTPVNNPDNPENDNQGM